jgi:methyl-accepting chemotaxis protein
LRWAQQRIYYAFIISEASKEQSSGIEQVNIAISQMDKVVQQNAANAEESASASEEMNAQAEQLKSYVVDLAAVVTGRMDQRGGIYKSRRIQSVSQVSGKFDSKTKRLPLSNTNGLKPSQQPHLSNRSMWQASAAFQSPALTTELTADSG